MARKAPPADQGRGVGGPGAGWNLGKAARPDTAPLMGKGYLRRGCERAGQKGRWGPRHQGSREGVSWDPEALGSLRELEGEDRDVFGKFAQAAGQGMSPYSPFPL